MLDTAAAPIVFRRPSAPRVLALAVVVLLAMPAVALFAGFVAGAIVNLLTPAAALPAGIAAGALAALAVLTVAWRDWRRKRRVEVRLWPERLEADLPEGSHTLAYGELLGIRFLPRLNDAAVLEIRTGAGQTIELRGFPSMPELHGALVERAGEALAARLCERIERGEEVRFEEPACFLRWCLFWGAILTGVGLAMAADLLLGLGWWPESGLGGAAFAIGTGVVLLGRWRVARGGGLAVDRRGIRGLRGDERDRVAWRDVQIVPAAGHVAVEHVQGLAASLRLGASAENYDVFLQVAGQYLWNQAQLAGEVEVAEAM